MILIRCTRCGIDDQRDGRLFYPSGDEEYFDGDPCPRCGAPLMLVEEPEAEKGQEDG